MKSFSSASNDVATPEGQTALGSGGQQASRFYLTGVNPCPYLPGQVERKGFTYLKQPDPVGQNDCLSHAGFRRYQNVAYRPLCPSCNACRSVRVDAAAFRPGSSFRRILRVNQDLVCRKAKVAATREFWNLFKSYTATRHGGEGGMYDMNFRAFSTMMSDSPVRTSVFEYRCGATKTAPLVAVALTDTLNDGLSMVYTFFDPHIRHRSLGTYMILDHILQCNRQGRPYVYLGYWIRDSRKMDYKRRFTPLQILDGSRWRAFETGASDEKNTVCVRTDHD